MSRKSVNFRDKRIKKGDLYKNKKVTKIDDIDVNKIWFQMSHMVQKIHLNTLLDTMIMMLSDHYAWSFHKWLVMLEGNTTMSFKISDNKLLKKYNRIWKRVEKLWKIEFDSKPVYDDNDKYIKAKIIIYGVTVNTNFRDKKMPKEKAPCKSLSKIMLDFVVKVKKKHYPQTL